MSARLVSGRRHEEIVSSTNELPRKEEAHGDDGGKVTLRERFEHFTWAWFTLPMSTGAISLLLTSTPHRFPGLETIGTIVFLFDAAIFLALCAAISARFVMDPSALRRSLQHPTEALFFPTAWLALVNVFNGIQLYGVPSCGPWLVVVIRILFWMYAACAILVAIFQYWYLFAFSYKKLTTQSMTPAWVLPIFPVMLCGTFASLIAVDQPPAQRVPIIIAGFTFQGLGWMVALLMYAACFQRLLLYGLPAPNLRPGMFILVGPPSFTGLALIQLSSAVPLDYGYFANHPASGEIAQTMAFFSAIFLWTLGFWFFCIALISVLAGVKKITFHLVWWTLVFPNVGFTIATIEIGRQLESEPILWLCSIMTILLVCMWIFVFISHVRAVLMKQILMPGRDEDKGEYKEDDRRHGIFTP